MSRPQDIDGLVQSLVKDQDSPQHIQLRALRRISSEALGRAVFERDAEGMEFCIRRLHRLGVTRDKIEELVMEAQL
jgi:hypothetical protein